MMNIETKFLILFFFFLNLPFDLLAQNDWNVAYNDASELFKNGEIEKANEKAEEALYIAKNEHTIRSLPFANSLRLLTLCSFATGKFNEGIDHELMELTVRDLLDQVDTLEYVKVLNNLGLLYQVADSIGQAKKYFNRASLLINQADVDPNRNYSFVLLNQAKLYHANGETAVAIQLYQQILKYYRNLKIKDANYAIALYLLALGQGVEKNESVRDIEEAISIFRQINNTSNEFYLEALYQWASYRLKEGNIEEADSLFGELQNQLTQLPDSLNYMYASVLNNSGLIAQATHAGEKAEYFLLKAYNLRREILPKTSPELLASVSNLALYYKQQNRVEDAQEILTEAIDNLKAVKVIPIQFGSILNMLGIIYWEKGQFLKAHEKLIQARDLAQDHKEINLLKTTLQINVNYNLARNYQSRGRYDSALINFQEGIKICKTELKSNTKTYLSLLTGLASLFQDMGKLQKSIEVYEQAIGSVEEEQGDKNLDYANMRNNLGLLYQAMGNYDQAELNLIESAEIKRSFFGPVSQEYMSVTSNLGLLYTEMGDYPRAEALLQQAVNFHANQPEESKVDLARDYTNLARLKQAMGKYTEAEPLLKKSIEIRKKVFGPENPLYADALNNLGLFYQTMGNFKEAEPNFVAARNIYKEKFGEQHPDYASTIQNLATLYQSQDRAEEAEFLLKKTIEIDRSVLGDDHPSLAISLNNLAAFYHGEAQFGKEEPLLREALEINEMVFGKEHPIYASTLYNLAVLNSSLCQYQEADSLFNEVLKIRAKTLGTQHPAYAQTLYGKAALYAQQNEFTKAAPIFDEVISNYLEQIRVYFPALSEKEKSAFYRQIEPVIRDYREFAIHYFQYCQKENLAAQTDSIVYDLYNLQLATKALLLNSSNKIRKHILSSSDDQLRALFTEWVQLKEYLIKLYAQSSEELSIQNIDIPSIEQQANEVEKQISARSSLFSQNTEETNRTWQDVKHALALNEVAIEIIRIPSLSQKDMVLYSAIILKKDQVSPDMVILSQGEELENKIFSYYRNAIRYSIRDTLSFKSFWQPIAEKISPTTETIYFAADGVYNKINLNTLLDEKAGKSVIDQYEIRLVSSTRDIIADSEILKNQDKTAWLFGFPSYNLGLTSSKPQHKDDEEKPSDILPFSENIQPLPGTLQEVNYLAELLNNNHWQVQKYVKEEASEKVIKTVKNPTVLHFATHGFFMSDLVMGPNSAQKAFGINIQNVKANPLLRSGLLFAGAANTIAGKETYLPTEINNAYDGDGILTAYEVMNMDLEGTDLVVLSACETGLGEIRNGEGVYGLQRAFLVAGAQSIIMTLWKVKDTYTRQIMELFYANWLSGMDKYAALTEALRTFKTTTKDPKYWGAFVMISK